MIIEKIKEIIEKYQKILFLEGYTLKIVKGCENEKSIMEISHTYPYQSIIISFEEKFIKKLTKKEIENVVIHELIHTITDPLYNKAVKRFCGDSEIEDERELLTDKISNIIIKLTTN